jgi:hypothetical protein
MVLVGNLLLRTYNLPLVTEFLTAATAILTRSCALGTGDRAFGAIFPLALSIPHSLWS